MRPYYSKPLSYLWTHHKVEALCAGGGGVRGLRITRRLASASADQNAEQALRTRRPVEAGD